MDDTPQAAPNPVGAVDGGGTASDHCVAPWVVECVFRVSASRSWDSHSPNAADVVVVEFRPRFSDAGGVRSESPRARKHRSMQPRREKSGRDGVRCRTREEQETRRAADGATTDRVPGCGLRARKQMRDGCCQVHPTGRGKEKVDLWPRVGLVARPTGQELAGRVVVVKWWPPRCPCLVQVAQI
jgi:hypothetical protein